MNRWLQNVLGVAHVLLVAAVIGSLGCAVYGAWGLNRTAISLLQDLDHAVCQPLTPADAAQARAILASARGIAQDVETITDAMAHPSKGQQVLKVIHQLIPAIF